MDSIIKNKAIKVFNSCGIVIFPTDTAFGIGCRIDCEVAVKRVFNIKKRPLEQPVPVLIDSVVRAGSVAEKISIKAVRLMEKHWPGGLTIIVNCRQRYIGPATGGTDTIGLRIPDDKDIINIIKTIDSPIIAPSANLHGQSTPYKLREVNPDLISGSDLAIDGICKTNQASTVIDCTGNTYKIVRQGPIVI